MTRSMYRRWVRLQNHVPFLLFILVICFCGAYAVDRLASLGSRFARAML